MTHRILTASRVMALAEIIEAVRNTSKIAVSVPMSSDGVLYGHARSITNANGAFLSIVDDVRDGRLRITTREGMEYTMPIHELVELWTESEAGVYDWK